MFFSILEQSLLFFPLALGLFISYSILKTPDLTTDGSFVFGAACFGLAVQAGTPPFLAIGTAIGAGALCGVVVSFLQIRLHPLISGILLVFILNTITLKLLGKPNLSLLDQPSLITLPFLALLGGALFLGVTYFLSSKTGLALHGLGNNPTLLNLFGKNSFTYRTLGLAISNGLVGFCGAITAQSNGYVDISMGTGVVLIALGTVILGQRIYQFFIDPPMKHAINLICCFIGILLYFLLVNLLISIGLDPVYLRLMIGISLIGFLFFARNKTLQKASS